MIIERYFFDSIKIKFSFHFYLFSQCPLWMLNTNLNICMVHWDWSPFSLKIIEIKAKFNLSLLSCLCYLLILWHYLCTIADSWCLNYEGHNFPLSFYLIFSNKSNLKILNKFISPYSFSTVGGLYFEMLMKFETKIPDYQYSFSPESKYICLEFNFVTQFFSQTKTCLGSSLFKKEQKNWIFFQIKNIFGYKEKKNSFLIHNNESGTHTVQYLTLLCRNFF